MIARAAVHVRRVRRMFTRSYWELRVFPLSKSEGTGSAPGLIMIQIDGLSQKQMRKALSEGRMPFLKRLLEREKYQEHTHYSGLPSSTPAVQGELFYGAKSCVPAFHFFDRQSNEVFTMFNPLEAAEIEKRLSRENRGLLEGGSCYSNIFSGGAQESHFTISTIGLQGFFKALNPMTWIFLFLFHIDIVVRTLVLFAVELVLGFSDCIRGALKGQSILMELQFILTRVFMCVVMRELIVLGAKIDIARGLPVIHLNFLGYDEQAHRRGPSSNFAHWCLKGIDSSIKQLWKEARLAERRDYDLWVYSDHGQQDTLPYPEEHGTRVEEVIAKIFGETPAASGRASERNYGCCGGRFGKHSHKPVVPEAHAKKGDAKTPQVRVAGMGPLAHIYPGAELTQSDKFRVAEEIVHKGNVPLVLVPLLGHAVRAITARGSFELPGDAAVILGHNHPFLQEVTKDLIELCHHPNAGELVASGWIVNEKARTFPMENGSHAGFSWEETQGFALLPQDAPLPAREHEYLRPLHLRETALRVLGRCETGVTCETRRPAESKVLRIASYNIHGCMGMDGKISADRIARVLARQNADAIFLQELDGVRERSGCVHQAEVIAKKLQMEYHFHPSVITDGPYGNAILSRYPMRLVKAGALPRQAARREFEPRGALWVEIDLQGTKVQLINTHLSLWPKERLMQSEALLGPDWLGDSSCKNPVVLAGDFNSRPSSPPYKRIMTKLLDAQLILESHKPYGTWLGAHPFSRIDHVFVSPDVRVKQVLVPATELDRVSSDHFPLFVDLEVSREESCGAEKPEIFSRSKDKREENPMETKSSKNPKDWKR